MRLPKFLDEGARADGAQFSMTAGQSASSNTTEKENGDADKPDGAGDAHQVHFEEPEEDHRDYDEDYEHDEEYEYNYWASAV